MSEPQTSLRNLEIPLFPKFKPLELSDAEWVKEYFENFHPSTSDYSFANLYFWKSYDNPKLTLINNNLCILLQPKDSTPYFLFPVGSEKIEETLEECFSYLKQKPQLRMVPEDMVEKYFSDTSRYQCTLDRDNCDYLYLVKDLIELKGKKYDGKRNWIKRFLANYRAEIVDLTPDLVPQAFSLLEKWKKSKRGSMLRFEVEVISEALKKFRTLSLIGRALLIDDKVEAFMIAGKLNPETAIVYIQVANAEIPGLPQYFHQRFTAETLSLYRYVNWEQDLGHPGLRKAKLSYHPLRLINKYDVAFL